MQCVLKRPYVKWAVSFTVLLSMGLVGTELYTNNNGNRRC
jgi:hypothetical protein